MSTHHRLRILEVGQIVSNSEASSEADWINFPVTVSDCLTFSHLFSDFGFERTSDACCRYFQSFLVLLRLVVEVAAVVVEASDDDLADFDWESKSFHHSMTRHNPTHLLMLCRPEMKADDFSFRKMALKVTDKNEKY